MNNSALSFQHVPRQRAGWSRTGSIAFVVALHVAAIWALANGLIEKFSNAVPPHTTVRVIDTTTPPPTPMPPPNPVMTRVPTAPTAPTPVITIASESSNSGIRTTTEPPPTHIASMTADTPASAVASTHSTPIYPALARRLGQQGTVILALTIGADGSVSDAQVATSSGVAELDQAAVAWVKTHWRYKPALHTGTPVPSSARAAVKFDLKEGG